MAASNAFCFLAVRIIRTHAQKVGVEFQENLPILALALAPMIPPPQCLFCSSYFSR